MNLNKKSVFWRICSAALQAAAIWVTNHLFGQGSPVLFEHLPLFMSGLLACLVFVLFTWGLLRYAGLTLMAIGVAMLVALHIAGLTFSNHLLLVSLALVLIGFVGHIAMLKLDSRY